MARFCFFRLGATPLFMSGSQDPFGGAEVRAFTFATELARHSRHEISFAVASKSGLPNQHDTGVLITPMPATRCRGARRLCSSIRKRFVKRPTPYPNISRINADAIGCFGVHHPTASVIEACRRTATASVLFLTSDEDVDSQPTSPKEHRRRKEHNFALAYADLIVVQSEKQKRRLKTRFGRSGLLIRNPIDLDTRLHIQNQGFRVLWVGRADYDSKRADLCLRIAKHCPNIAFDVVMNETPAGLFEEIAGAATENCTIYKQVPFDQIERLFAKSSVLLNTSNSEGFPNAFLQAGKYGKPILSLCVDPGEMVNRHNCGKLAGSVERAVELLQVTNRLAWHESGIRARKYVESFHDKKTRTHELANAIDELVRARLPISMGKAA